METKTASPQPPRPAREDRLSAIALISLLLSGLVWLCIFLSWGGPQPTPGNCFLPWWLPFFNGSALLLIPGSLVFGIVAIIVPLAAKKGHTGLHDTRPLGIMNIIFAAFLCLAVVGANFPSQLCP
jgi:hypothetical protein